MSDNYFELFHLPIALPIDISELSRQYQQLQRLYHPDNFAIADDRQKAEMMQKSATINTAYQTLKDPIRAAEYRVGLAGVDINDEQRTIKDSAFLMEQFELREQLDEIDSSQDWDALDAFHRKMLQRKKNDYTQLLADINQNDWQSSQQKLYKLRYFSRLIEQIEQLEEKQFER